MAGSIMGLDHVIIGVKDLEGGRDDYRRLGFTPAPRGDHQGRATSNYCLMFAETYLEILGVVRPELDSGGLIESLGTRGEGLQRLALSTPDADAARADLERAGLHPQGPVDLARPLEATGEMVRFRNLMIPAEETGGLRMFLCGHTTPQLMRSPELMRHQNGAVAFAGITGIVTDPRAFLPSMQRVFGPNAVRQSDHGLTVSTGRGRIDLTSPAGFAMVHPGTVAPAMPLPNWYALRIAVQSVQAAASYLASQGVAYSPIGDGVRIDPQHARGVLLELIPA